MNAGPNIPVPPDRATLLAVLGVRNSQSEAVFDAVVQLAARALHVPVAILSFLDEDTVWEKARIGWPMATLPLHDSLCKDIHSAGQVLQVDDMHADPRYRDNPLVRASPQLISYTGVPVVFSDEVIGTLSVIDTAPRHLDDEELAPLFDLCTVVTGLLEARIEQWRRRQEEARSLDFARISGDWIWESDERDHYCWIAGDNFERKTGLAPQGFIGGPAIDGPVVDFLGRPVEPPLRFTDLLKRRAAFSGVVLDIHINGRRLFISRSGEPRFTPSGEFTGFRGSSRDISAAVRDHQALQEAHHEKQVAQQASEAKSRFLSEVSHEVRTPLNAVMGFAELMELDRRNPLPPAQRERLALVRTAANKLLALVNDMLDLGRAEQGRLTVKLQPLELEAAVHGAVDIVRPQAESRSIEMHADIPAGLRVQADERGLDQVLLNLLSNAVKYNRAGQPVNVHCAVLPPHAELRIVDRGIGLTAEQLAQLFQPYNRLGAQHGSVGGTGLGLVISRALVDAMGGQLTLASQPGQGTTAVLRLPLADAASREAPAAAAAGVTSSGSRAPSRPDPSPP